MSTLSFYMDVIRALEEIGAPYMMVGAFAGSVFGVTRVTFDVDILVDLRVELECHCRIGDGPGL